MTDRVDREQVRQLCDHFKVDSSPAGLLAGLTESLLAELEQAERERDEALDRDRRRLANQREDWAHAEELEARLAAVPALAEALGEACDWLDGNLADPVTDGQEIASADRELVSSWRESLAAYEQATQKATE